MSTWVDAIRSKHDEILFEEVYIQSYNSEDFEKYTKGIFDSSTKLSSEFYYNAYEEHKAGVRNKKIHEILTKNEIQLKNKQELFCKKIEEIGY